MMAELFVSGELNRFAQGRQIRATQQQFTL
jgi:hypothetical protein